MKCIIPRIIRENKMVLTLLKRQFLLEVGQAWSCVTPSLANLREFLKFRLRTK